MRSGQQIDEAFQALRSTPTEFSLEQVESLILTLPAIPWWKNWLHYFNLNSILMSAIAISIAVASIFLPIQAEQEVQTVIPTSDSIELSAAPSNIQSLPTSQPEPSQVAMFVTAGEPEENQIIKLDLPQDVDTSILEQVETETFDRTPALDLLQLPKAGARLVTNREPRLEVTGCAPIPHQGNRGIRQFKSELLHSLQEDHLIHSIRQNVLIEVPEGEIRVNGQTLNKTLFSKYSEFLYASIPPCQGRYLVISRQFFGAGSYTKDGYFKGLSINPEQMPSLQIFRASIFPDAIVSTEMTSDQMLVRSAEAAKVDVRNVVILEPSELRANQALPLMEWPKMKRLKRKLVAKLLKDKLISKAHKKAIVELHEDQVVVNGKALDKGLEAVYRKLIAINYGVNSGPQREIHLAPKFIMIGDFGDYGEMLRGQSHGRNMIVGKTRPSGLYADKGFRLRHDVKRWE